MIERNLLDQTKDLRPPQRMVQSNFGMLFGNNEGQAMEEQRRIAERRAEQGLSQNNRVLELPNQGGGMPANPEGRMYAGGSPGLYAPGGRFNRVGGIIQRQNDENSKLKSFRQLQGNLEPAIKFDGSGTIPNRVDRGGRNPSQTYQNQENRSFSNSYGNSYGNSMSGYQPQYGSRGGFGMQQPMYGGGMGIMGLQSPFGGYGMQSPFGSYGGGMQQPMYGGGMQSMECNNLCMVVCSKDMECNTVDMATQYQSSPFSPQFGGGIGSMSPGMGGGYGQPPQCGGGYGQQPPSYGGEYGGYNTQRDYDQRPQTQPGPSGMLIPQMRTM
jgi:hypothetical protein